MSAMSDIRDIPLFADLDDGQLQDLATRAHWSSYEANEMLIDYGEETSEVRFVLSGKVRILLRTPTGKEVILDELGPGQYFGEMAAIEQSIRSANVTALEHCEMCVLPASAFLELIKTNCDLALKVMCTLSARVRDLNHRLGEHTFLTTRQRLCAELLRRSKRRLQNPAERIVSPPPLQKDLADRIGTQREVVTRELSALKRKKLVDSTRGGLVLLDPDGINAIISDALTK
jgi:CRP-like cAMP-binding protein